MLLKHVTCCIVPYLKQNISQALSTDKLSINTPLVNQELRLQQLQYTVRTLFGKVFYPQPDTGKKNMGN